MRFATDVIDLMGAYPGREFKMGEVFRYVVKGRKLDLKQRRAVRFALREVMIALSDAGSITIRPPSARGSYGVYVWRSQ